MSVPLIEEGDSGTEQGQQQVQTTSNDDFFGDVDGPALAVRASDGSTVVLTFEDIFLLLILAQVLIALYTTYMASKS
jgi:hypothetical protein